MPNDFFAGVVKLSEVDRWEWSRGGNWNLSEFDNSFHSSMFRGHAFQFQFGKEATTINLEWNEVKYTAVQER